MTENIKLQLSKFYETIKSNPFFELLSVTIYYKQAC